MENKLKESI